MYSLLFLLIAMVSRDSEFFSLIKTNHYETIQIIAFGPNAAGR